MAGPRLLSPTVAKRLATSPRLLGQARHLHMTGAATYPSRFLTASKPIAIVPKQQAESEVRCPTSVNPLLPLVLNNPEVTFIRLPQSAAATTLIYIRSYSRILCKLLACSAVQYHIIWVHIMSSLLHVWVKTPSLGSNAHSTV